MQDVFFSVRVSHSQCDTTPQTKSRSHFRAKFTSTDYTWGLGRHWLVLRSSVQVIAATSASLTYVVLPAITHTQTSSYPFKESPCTLTVEVLGTLQIKNSTILTSILGHQVVWDRSIRATVAHSKNTTVEELPTSNSHRLVHTFPILLCPAGVSSHALTAVISRPQLVS
jgi:hypothetical protein